MNENHRLIKDVSNALNFYMERTRREEGFDLSGILRPGYDLNQFKFNKLFGYSTGYDTTMKKILTPQLCLPKSFRPESEEIKLREKFYKDELKYHLKFDRNRRKEVRSQSQKGVRSKSVNGFASSKSSEKKPKPKVPAGLLTIRSTHTPALTKREKLSMVNITSKIMSASSELCFQKEDILLMKNLADTKPNNTCYVRKSLSQSRREEQEEYDRRLLNRHREYERLMALKKQKSPEDDKKEEEDTFEEDTQEDLDSDKKIKGIITPVNERKPSQQSLEDEEEKQKRKRDERLNQVKDLKEVSDGETVRYRVVIKTGERLGSSTEATIKMKFFGSKGRSKLFKLKDSKTHKIPFRKGNTDVFDLEVFDVGSIKAIHIGHSEKNIEYSWFIDYIGVEDQDKNIVYTFEPTDWFSTTSEDGCTSRMLLKKTSTAMDSNSDSDSSTSSKFSKSSRSSASSGASSSTLKSGKSSRSKKTSSRSKNVSKLSFTSSSSSSLHSANRSSTPRSVKKSNEYESEHEKSLHKTESVSRSARSTKSNRKDSTSSSVREAENEISSQKFEFSPAQSRLDSQLPNPNTTGVNLSIFEAVEMNRLDVLKEKLQMSPLDIKKTDLSDRSLLILACEHGFDNIVKYLIDNDDELISKDTPFGFFPVHICALYNRIDCIKLLNEFDTCSLNSKDNDGNTPLHLAAENGHLEMVKWLHDHDANVLILNTHHSMAYDVAKKHGHVEIANYLAEPSGIKNQISLENYGKAAFITSPFSRPDEPSPHNERSSSSRSNNKETSSRKSSKTRKSLTSSSSSDSDSESELKKKKAESSVRVESAEVKELVASTVLKSKRSSSSSSDSSDSSKSSARSVVSKKSEADPKKSRASSRANSSVSKNSKKSPSLLSNSSVSLRREISSSEKKSYSRQNSNEGLLSSKSNKSDSDESKVSSRSKKTNSRVSKYSMSDSKKNQANLVKYQVIIKTEESNGSCDKSPLRICFLGTIGKSKDLLLINSKTSEKLFQKNSTDVFDFEISDIGLIKGVRVGFENNSEFSCLFKYIGVENRTEKIFYTFDKPDWLSSTIGDGRTSRTILRKESSAHDSDSDSDSDSDVSSLSSNSASSLSSAHSSVSSLSALTASKGSFSTNRSASKDKLKNKNNTSRANSSTSKSSKNKKAVSTKRLDSAISITNY